jgi:predicted nucleic acid-binding protein
LSVFFDASALVPMLIQEAKSAAIDTLVDGLDERPIVCDFAAGEVASALTRLVRMGALTSQIAQSRLNDFDAWRAGDTQGIDVLNTDVLQASAFVRQFDLGLRMPDALHLAIAQRSGLPLLTLDERMVKAGAALGVQTVRP